MDLKKMEGFKNVKEFALATFYYISSSIFGPLILFLSLGYLLDNFLGTKPLMLIIGCFIAFVTTNVLLFKKVAKLNRKIDSYKKVDVNKEEKIKID